MIRARRSTASRLLQRNCRPHADPPGDARQRGFTAAMLAVFLVCIAVVPSPAASPPKPPIVGATSAILMDAHSGHVLYAKSTEQRWPPASTTKILTAILAMEHLSDDTLVVVSERAARERSGSAIGLEIGERWKARDLLYALLMHSANDAAVALAEGVAGSVEQFAGQMNARAKNLGATRTSFISPHGRYHPQHLTTAHDLAVMTRAALRIPRFAEIVRTQTWKLNRSGQKPLMLINTNSLLWRYRGADGVKTGWIAQSGRCLVASATREDWQLIAIVLNAPREYRDAAALLDYGFGAFALTKVAAKDQILYEGSVGGGARAVPAVAAEDVIVPIRRGASIETRVTLTARAPVRKGQTVGSAVFSSEGREVARVTLVAGEDVGMRSWWARFIRWLHRLAAGSERAP